MSTAPLTINELKQEIMVATGAAVIALQFFELYASGCLLCLRGEGPFSPEDLFSGDQSRRLPTLRVLVRLGKHFPVDPVFQDRIDSFIENRNILIHRFFIPDLACEQPATEEMLYKKLEFILSLMDETAQIKPVFAGLYSLLTKAQIAAGEINLDSDLSKTLVEMEESERAFLSILHLKRPHHS